MAIVFQVRTTWPSGKKAIIKVMPGDPFLWPNKELPAIPGEGLRAIATKEDAAEYVMRNNLNRLSPIKIEWPSKTEPLDEVLDSQNLEMPAHVKALIGDPASPSTPDTVIVTR
jgi:hypothetical protein